MNYSEIARLGGLAAAKTQHIKKQKRIDEYNKNPKLCKNCSLVIEYNKKINSFCSKSCAATINNAGKDRHLAVRKIKQNKTKKVDKKPKIKKMCLFCNIVEIKYGKSFCSTACSIEYNKVKIYNKIENGDVTFPTRQYRNYLIYKNGPVCILCGWCEINKKTGKCPITIDHINGNPDDNRLENLRLLCPNCHSLTPTYCSLNVGNGSEKSKKRRDHLK